MQNRPGCVVILGTGGTIAGVAPSAAAHTGYTAGALGVEDLIAAVPALQGLALEAESVARIDSCNMDHATWAALAARVAHHLVRDDVAGLVITHGTDTLEETAYFLHRVLAPNKPVVLTAAMRPASALSADGPQNLLDAVTVAREPDARGVLAVLAGRIHGGADLRKLHGYRVDAFDSGDAGTVGLIEDGRLRCSRAWPDSQPHAAAGQLPAAAGWPVVDLVLSHAGARGAALDAAVASGAKGIVIAGTGNGTVHAELLAAARRAESKGVVVRRSSRCILGGVVGESKDALPSAGTLTPVQARIELLLDLIVASHG